MSRILVLDAQARGFALADALGRLDRMFCGGAGLFGDLQVQHAPPPEVSGDDWVKALPYERTLEVEP